MSAPQSHGSSLAERVRHDFDIFRKRPEILYLDTAATSQHPDAVLHVGAGVRGGEGQWGRLHRAACPQMYMCRCAPVLCTSNLTASVASTQEMHHYYHRGCANVHKGVEHELRCR